MISDKLNLIFRASLIQSEVLIIWPLALMKGLTVAVTVAFFETYLKKQLLFALIVSTSNVSSLFLLQWDCFSCFSCCFTLAGVSYLGGRMVCDGFLESIHISSQSCNLFTTKSSWSFIEMLFIWESRSISPNLREKFAQLVAALNKLRIPTSSLVYLTTASVWLSLPNIGGDTDRILARLNSLINVIG